MGGAGSLNHIQPIIYYKVEKTKLSK